MVGDQPKIPFFDSSSAAVNSLVDRYIQPTR
jgi:hypothetical protein